MLYVTIGHLAGTALRKALSPVVVADDNLLIGPSRIGIEDHRAARARYWGNAPSRQLDEHLASGPHDDLYVLLPPTGNGLLTLSRICFRAHETGRAVHVMELAAGTSLALRPGIDPIREECLDTSRIAKRLPTAVRWSSLQAAFAGALWRLWCRPSPVAFSRFCASANDLHPQLANLGRYHAGLFPRRTKGGFSLARFDELILRQLCGDWLTPATVYARAIASSPELGAWLSCTGDLYLAARLLAWATHTQGRIVERRRESSPSGSEMLAWSFRWCKGGAAILDQLPQLQLAPSVTIGGAVAYDPAQPWACRADAAGTPYLVRSAVRGRRESAE